MRRALLVVIGIAILGVLGACRHNPPPDPEPEPRGTIRIESGTGLAEGQIVTDPSIPECVPGSNVVAHVEVGGGLAGNTISIRAHCDDARVADASTSDNGNGTTRADTDTGNQVDGVPGCSFTAIQNPPLSNWTGSCTFY